MNIKIKHEHFELSYYVDFKYNDVLELGDFTLFVEKLLVQAPNLFLTDFTTMYKNKLIKFTRNLNHPFTVDFGE